MYLIFNDFFVNDSVSEVIHKDKPKTAKVFLDFPVNIGFMHSVDTKASADTHDKKTWGGCTVG